MSGKNTALVLRLKREMTKAGINARQLAERADVGRSFVYDIMNGKSSNPTSLKLGAIANVLGVSIPFLVEGSSNDNEIKANNGEYVLVEWLEGTTSLDNKPRYFSRSWIEANLDVANHSQLCLFSVDDKETTEGFQTGDVVLVNTSINSLNDNKISANDYLLYTLGPGKYKINKAEFVERTSHSIIGKLIWFSRTL